LRAVTPIVNTSLQTFDRTLILVHSSGCGPAHVGLPGTGTLAV
jgi:hypothetical protein